jgi:hypothetical protein
MPTHELNDVIRRSQPIETQRGAIEAANARAEMESPAARVAALEPMSWHGGLQEVLARIVAELQDDIEEHGEAAQKAVKSLSETLLERMDVELGLLRQDLVDRMTIREFGAGLADEGLEHLKLAERAVAEVKKQVTAAVAEIAARLAAMEKQLRNRDQSKAALLTKLAQERAAKLEVCRMLGAKVDELAAENKRLRRFRGSGLGARRLGSHPAERTGGVARSPFLAALRRSMAG